MRLLQANDALRSALSLSAEIDKRGHGDIKRKDQKNPDFVFHKYGTFRMNEVVIEVKGETSNGIFKDFDTLNLYCEKYQYKNAYFIIYNYDLDDFKHFLINKENFFNKLSEIVIICKKDVNISCEIITLNKLREDLYS